MDKEKVFEEIVSLASEATGKNSCFDPEYGLDLLNQIRVTLGLEVVDQHTMRKLLCL